MRERIAIKEYASLHEGAKKVQGCYRQGVAITGYDNKHFSGTRTHKPFALVV